MTMGGVTERHGAAEFEERASFGSRVASAIANRPPLRSRAPYGVRVMSATAGYSSL